MYMKKIIQASQRYFSNMWNIQSHFLFSFSNYYDPSNMNWGQLRVFNDDFIAWKSWFPLHPHKYYEIVTVMLSWTITHQDSLWNKEKISAWSIQVTNTGSWIYHSECNEENEDILLYQIWFAPEKPVKIPSYYTASFEENTFKNNLFTLASWIEKQEEKNTLISDVSIRRWIFDKWQTLGISFLLEFGFLYITFWKILLENGETIESKDQVRIQGEKQIYLTFLEETEVIFIESK